MPWFLPGTHSKQNVIQFPNTDFDSKVCMGAVARRRDPDPAGAVLWRAAAGQALRPRHRNPGPAAGVTAPVGTICHLPAHQSSWIGNHVYITCDHTDTSRLSLAIMCVSNRGWARDVDGAVSRTTCGRSCRETLTALGPSFIKAGQVLASRPDIIREDYMNELCILQVRRQPAALAVHFHATCCSRLPHVETHSRHCQEISAVRLGNSCFLQDDVPSFPDAQAFQIMEEDLGRPLAAVFSSISEHPIAAASLGQVSCWKL